jgi:type II secretory pathway pseudopilin PulG
MTVTSTSRISELSRRRALTLVELVVVIAILVALSGLIIPLVQGLSFQTNAATNATVVDDVNRAIGTYATRFDAQPDSWDSLLNGSGSIFSKVHKSLREAVPPLVEPVALEDHQLESLAIAGIYNVRDATEGGTSSPDLSNDSLRTLAIRKPDGTFEFHASKTLLCLTMTGSGDARRPVLNAGFRINQYHDGDSGNEFVVLGLGRSSSIQGSSTMQVPLIQNADPTNNYARVCCVYMVPSSSSTAAVFPARYVGCFLPDGTTARDNISRYNNSEN